MNWYYLSNGSGGLTRTNDLLRRHRVSPSRSSYSSSPAPPKQQQRRPPQQQQQQRLSSSFSLVDCFRVCCEAVARSDERHRQQDARRERLLERRRQLNAARHHSPLSLEARRPAALKPLPSLTEDEEVFYSVPSASKRSSPQRSPVSTTTAIV